MLACILIVCFRIQTIFHMHLVYELIFIHIYICYISYYMCSTGCWLWLYSPLMCASSTTSREFVILRGCLMVHTHTHAHTHTHTHPHKHTHTNTHTYTHTQTHTLTHTLTHTHTCTHTHTQTHTNTHTHTHTHTHTLTHTLTHMYVCKRLFIFSHGLVLDDRGNDPNGSTNGAQD